VTVQLQRQAVVEEALTWLGTPFEYGQCVKGVGVDCGRFPAAVFDRAGVKQIDILKIPQIPAYWFLHKREGVPSPYLEIFLKYTTEYVPPPGTVPEPGDIVLAKEARDWAHAAIVIAWPKVIGAAYEHCVTVWENIHLSPQYSHRQLKYLNPWGPGAGGNP
jgi:hypothetical protein